MYINTNTSIFLTLFQNSASWKGLIKNKYSELSEVVLSRSHTESLHIIIKYFTNVLLNGIFFSTGI